MYNALMYNDSHLLCHKRVQIGNALKGCKWEKLYSVEKPPSYNKVVPVMMYNPINSQSFLTGTVALFADGWVFNQG